MLCNNSILKIMVAFVCIISWCSALVSKSTPEITYNRCNHTYLYTCPPEPCTLRNKNLFHHGTYRDLRPIDHYRGEYLYEDSNFHRPSEYFFDGRISY